MTPKRRTTVHILVAAVAGGVLWLVSGWAAAGITLSSTRYASALQLVIPPTIPSTTFYQAAPWNTVLPLCGAVGFAAALAVGYLGLDALTARRAAPGWARFLAAWLIVAGVYRIIFAIRVRKEIEGEWLIALSGVLAIVLGGLYVINPVGGLAVTTIWIGAAAIVYGVLQIIAAFKVRRLTRLNL